MLTVDHRACGCVSRATTVQPGPTLAGYSATTWQCTSYSATTWAPDGAGPCLTYLALHHHLAFALHKGLRNTLGGNKNPSLSFKWTKLG